MGRSTIRSFLPLSLGDAVVCRDVWMRRLGLNQPERLVVGRMCWNGSQQLAERSLWLSARLADAGIDVLRLHAQPQQPACQQFHRSAGRLCGD